MMGLESLRGEVVVVLDTDDTLLGPGPAEEHDASEGEIGEVIVLGLSFFLFKYSCKLT